jgi:hypothetical protein
MRQKRITAWTLVSQRGNMMWKPDTPESEAFRPILYKTLKHAQEATKSFPAYRVTKVDVIVRETLW